MHAFAFVGLDPWIALLFVHHKYYNPYDTDMVSFPMFRSFKEFLVDLDYFIYPKTI